MIISVVIPNYDGELFLAKNLKKVIEAVENYDGEVELIIVDDASTDKSMQRIKDYESKIKNFKIIKNEKNLGFASTVNRGAKEATGEIIVLLNTDVSPDIDFLKPLMLRFSDPEVFAVGCLDKSLENERNIQRGRGLGGWQKGFLIHRRGEVDKTNTLWVSGGSGAFRKSIWDKLEGMCELYNPFYWEDIDLSYRALKSGYKIFFEPKSIVVHEHERGTIRTKYSSFQIKTIAYRNQFIFVWRNATDWDLLFKHILWFPYHFLRGLTTKDWPFFQGFFQALQRLPEVVQSRSKIRSFFIKTDNEVTKEFLYGK